MNLIEAVKSVGVFAVGIIVAIAAAVATALSREERNQWNHDFGE